MPLPVPARCRLASCAAAVPAVGVCLLDNGGDEGGGAQEEKGEPEGKGEEQGRLLRPERNALAERRVGGCDPASACAHEPPIEERWENQPEDVVSESSSEAGEE